MNWKRHGIESKWRRLCKYEEGWIDCWSAPNVLLDIEFIYHPLPVPGPPHQADLSSPEREELNNLTTNSLKPKELSEEQTGPSTSKKDDNPFEDFDPNTLEADRVRVDLYVPSSTAYLYGTLIRNFMHIKENIFGEDQQFTPMDSYGTSTSAAAAAKDSPSDDNEQNIKEFDRRLYRPLEVILGH